jgi:hypothetical protein
MNPMNLLNTFHKDILRFIAAMTKVGRGPSQGDVADYIAKTHQRPMRTAAMKQELDLLRRKGLLHWEKNKFQDTVRVLISVT